MKKASLVNSHKYSAKTITMSDIHVFNALLRHLSHLHTKYIKASKKQSPRSANKPHFLAISLIMLHSYYKSVIYDSHKSNV